MIKNIIFDVGNVLVEFEPEKIIKKCTRFSKEDPEFYALKEAIFNDKILLWDSGLVSRKEITKIICNDLIEMGKANLVPYCLDIFNSWYDTLKVDYKMFKLLQSLRLKGFGGYILSNASEDFCKIEQKFYNCFYSLRLSDDNNIYKIEEKSYNCFDGIMLSYQEKLLKPGLQIFKNFLYVYDLKPEECLFIDDKEENILAAESLGIKGILFENYSYLLLNLNKMLGIEI